MPRTPTALRLVKSNPGKRPMPAREPKAPPISADNIPPPPEVMSPYAAGAWRRLAPLLAGMGVLTEADLIAFERLCECYAEVQTARDAIAAAGGATYETTTDKGDTMYRSRPEAAAMADADRRLKTWLTEFGLTPAARSRVSVQGEQTDDLAKYFG